MKNYILATLLGGLVLWTGCTNDELTQDIASDQPHVLKVKVESTRADTRTQVGEDGSVTWTENDQIGVFVEGETTSIPFTFSSMTGDVASFTGTLPEGKEPTAAYYPYQEEARLEGNTLDVLFPHSTEYTDHSGGPMLGLPDGKDGLYFKHLCGLLVVTVDKIPEGAEKLEIIGKSYDLEGNFRVKDIAAEEAVLQKWNLYNNLDVTYTFNPKWAGQRKTFYIPMPIAEHKISVKLKDAADNILWSKNVTTTIGRGIMLNMPEVTETRPVIEVISHEDGYSFSGYQTYTTLTLKFRIDNFRELNDSYISLSNTEAYAHDQYHLDHHFGMDCREKIVEQTVDVFPGQNIYTIHWEGKDANNDDAIGEALFTVNYKEEPIIAEAVDLGLSVKWASHNVGASEASDYGGLYIWGDCTGADLRMERIEKFDIHEEIVNADDEIYGISGIAAYDIATNKWGETWRMPTEKEIEELIEKCEPTHDCINSVHGIRFTGPNGNSIFLPASGYYYGYHDLRSRGSYGRYLSGKEYYNTAGHGLRNIYGMDFDLPTFDNYYYIDGRGLGSGQIYHTMGCSVRPVSD